mmetsp:Transcript_5098/g.9702  ORF Transcript_5098/g.9702 Transcript_5098/m.9702 type:complete len:86 (-) Transcript_5098:11-268(-)
MFSLQRYAVVFGDGELSKPPPPLSGGLEEGLAVAAAEAAVAATTGRTAKWEQSATCTGSDTDSEGRSNARHRKKGEEPSSPSSSS